MNRQQAAIKIAKVNRFIKQMNYWSELGENIHPAAFGDDIYSMSTWVKEIQAYLHTDKNFLLLADLIECVGDISVIDEYIGKRSRSMEEIMRQSLVGLSRNMKALLAECEELRKASKGCYSMLPDPLCNETAIGLLERAVKADILNKEFNPSSKANYNNLKIVAYAVSQIMQFDRKHTYCYFEAMWHKRLSPVMLPSYKKGTCEETMGLYPEVDLPSMANIPPHSAYQAMANRGIKTNKKSRQAQSTQDMLDGKLFLYRGFSPLCHHLELWFLHLLNRPQCQLNLHQSFRLFGRKQISVQSLPVCSEQSLCSHSR